MLVIAGFVISSSIPRSPYYYHYYSDTLSSRHTATFAFVKIQSLMHPQPATISGSVLMVMH